MFHFFRNARHAARLGLAVALSLTGACVFAQGDPARGLDIAKYSSSNGDMIPDYSHAGYMGGDALPQEMPVAVRIAPSGGEDGARIQAAIDWLGTQPLNAEGVRGAVQLEAGQFKIATRLRITASGIELRGAGAGENGTILQATGLDRRTVIEIEGVDDYKSLSTFALKPKYVPVGALEVDLATTAGLKVGDMVSIRRPSTEAWITEVGMDRPMKAAQAARSWKAGELDLIWDRVVTAVGVNGVTLDAPLTMALEPKAGGGLSETYAWPGRVERVGVEDLQIVSDFDPARLKDEDHAWFGVTIQNARDVWISRVTFKHLAGSAVAVWENGARVTVEDCKSLDPVSEIGGWRRRTFFTSGGQTLFLRCYAEHGGHDFCTGTLAPGPNAFVHCEARETNDFSGPLGAWATGVLYDNVVIDGKGLLLGDRANRFEFAGWTAVNCLLWNCSAGQIDCYKPPTGQNWAFGCWAMFAGDGVWDQFNEFVNPKCLFQGLLLKRGKGDVAESVGPGVVFQDGSTNPSLEQIKVMTAFSSEPAPQLTALIDSAPKPQPGEGGVTLDALLKDHPDLIKAPEVITHPPLKLSNGWLTIDGKLIGGSRVEIEYWRGSTATPERARASSTGPDHGGITRFQPGRYGFGYTDDLEQEAGMMVDKGQIAFEHHPPLWYDRRRVDHERTRRPDSEVWPPFYEMPWARSGGDSLDWDGLSKFDLTRFNPWYFDRIREFADDCQKDGLVLIEEQYMQHNIIEAGAHWAEFPWRSANNINNTGFPEPPPYAGDKRIVQSHLFYDTTNPVRAPLHRAFIRHYLDELADKPNVVHLTSSEFTGPLPFVQFWLDTIGDWEKETGKHPLIGLSTSKEVQDAILDDPKRAAVVDVIDIRYWWYQDGGALYTPTGGLNLSPRQFDRMMHPKAASFSSIMKAVSESRTRFPQKAVIFSAGGGERSALAVVMAGGSMSGRLSAAYDSLVGEIPKMTPFPASVAAGETYALGQSGGQYLVYMFGADRFRIDLKSDAASYNIRWFSPGSAPGEPQAGVTIKGGGPAECVAPSSGEWLAWLTKQ